MRTIDKLVVITQVLFNVSSALFVLFVLTMILQLWDTAAALLMVITGACVLYALTLAAQDISNWLRDRKEHHE